MCRISTSTDLRLSQICRLIKIQSCSWEALREMTKWEICCKWEDNTKMYFEEIRYEGVDHQRRVLTNTAMNLR
jgi:hypothetical protein